MSEDERPGYTPLAKVPERFGVPRSTAWEWVMADRLPTYKFPRDRLTYIKDVELAGIIAEAAEYRGRGKPPKWRAEVGPDTGDTSEKPPGPID